MDKPSMKGTSVSLNKIYGDRQILALNNRVQYIKNRNCQFKLPFARISN